MKKAMVISVIGAGGKTTCIEKIAEEVRKQNRKAAVVTTTHMWIPHNYCVIGKKWEEALITLNKEGIVYFGAAAETEGKMIFPGREGYKALCECADVMLIEADGAKEKPIKLPDWSREPVIPENTDRILLLFGLSALGKSLEMACHRWELCKELMRGVKNGKDRKEWKKTDTVTKELALLLLKKGYLEELRRRFPEVSLTILLNQADNQERRIAGEWMKERLEREGIVCRVVRLMEKNAESEKMSREC